ncbi:MAG: U32 family peptidase, partial [Nitrospinota bacterium]
LHSALKAGADQIYFGINSFNMRARKSQNFTLRDIKKIAKICKDSGVRSSLTLNTVVFDKELDLLHQVVDTAFRHGISAVIASDMAVLSYCRSIGMSAHLSTLVNIANIESVKFYSVFSDVMVLARELTLQQIKSICEQIQTENIRGPSGNLVQVEVFAHGALCVAVSGKCYMSLSTFNSSANRGACIQNCRRRYRVIDEDSGNELVLENRYVMSPRDLLTVHMLKELTEAGVSVLKLEGRARKAEYVYTVTAVYREALNALTDGTYSQKRVGEWIERLKTVYNRGFWEGGYYLGSDVKVWSGINGTAAKKKKKYIGVVQKYFGKAKISEILLEAGTLKLGDEVIITGTTTGFVHSKVESIYLDKNPVQQAGKGAIITVPVSEKVRPKDKLFLFLERKVNR